MTQDDAQRLAVGTFNAEGRRQVGWRRFMQAEVTRYLDRTEEIVRRSETATRLAAIAAGISASAALINAIVAIIRLALGK